MPDWVILLLIFAGGAAVNYAAGYLMTRDLVRLANDLAYEDEMLRRITGVSR